MESSRHPYRKFVFAAIAKSGDGLYYTLTGARFGRTIRLEPAELELARLFDGTRDASTVRKAASETLHLEISPTELEGFANDLSTNDLLVPGSQEPLPVPTQTEGEAVNVGWNKGPRPQSSAPQAGTPSTVPGSLTGAAFTGSLTGLVGAFRGVVAPPSIRFSVSWLHWLGGLLNLPLLGVLTVLGLFALVGGSVVVMWSHRVDMGMSFLRLLDPWTLILSFIGCAYIVNFLAELSRASAIARLTRTEPVFGVLFGAGLIPRFHTHTGGPAEAADRGARLRIVGSTLVAYLLIFVIAIVTWLMFRNGHGFLPPLAIMLAMVASVFFFIQVNPLIKHDGYHWLVQWYQVSDIREQAFYTLFGYARPWHQSRKPSTTLLVTYGVISLIYIAWVITWILLFPGAWLQGAFGAVGVAIVLFLVLFGMYRTMRRSQAGRATIGATKITVDYPPRMDWVIIGILCALALFPYPYQPSGDFTVLPNARADIRSQTAGSVKQVMVKEGDVVKAGQVIALLSDDEERAAVATSKAMLDRLQANLKIAKQGAKTEEVDKARQQVATVQKKLQFSRAESNRLANAFKKKAISDQEYQRSLQIAEVDEQSLLEAKKNLALVGSPTRTEQVEGVEADIAREQAQLDLHETQLAATQIKSPIGGHIVSGTLRYAVGDYLQRGEQLASVEDATQLMVEIHMSETDVGEIAVGNKAFAKPWAFPQGGYPGVIREIAPTADKSNSGKVVRVVMAVDQPDGKLLPEMTGYAKVSAATYPAIVAFTRPLIRFVLVEIWSWLP